MYVPYNRTLYSDKKVLAIRPQKDMEDQKCILLSERSSSKTRAKCMISSIWHSRKGQTYRNKKQNSDCQGLEGAGDGEVTVQWVQSFSHTR